MNLALGTSEMIRDGVIVARWMFWQHTLKDELNAHLQQTYATSVYFLSTHVTMAMLNDFPPALRPTIIEQRAGSIVLVPIGCLHQVLMSLSYLFIISIVSNGIIISV